MGKWTQIVGLAAVALSALWAFGPRPSLDVSIRYDPATLPAALDDYLALTEAAQSDVRSGAEKEIVWAGDPGARTPLSVVYIHGFSASKEEIRPVPDRLAAALGANLYFARLSGHGQTGERLGASTAQDWWRDVGEALAIGRRIGERVLLIGTSTGATLAAIMLAEDGADVAGLIGVSPNFAVKAAPTAVLTAPFAQTVLPLLLGAERSWEPENEAHARWWTTRYPVGAVLEMGATLAAADRADFSAVASPVLFILSDADEVVDHQATRRVAASWGAVATVETVVSGPQDDPSAHVIAGDALSPNLTGEVVAIMGAWAETVR